MPIELVIDVFSGRPNPTVVVRGPEEAELLERLRPERPATNKETAPFSESLLGYRGVTVGIEGRRPRGVPAAFRVVNGFGLGGERPFRIADPAFEDFVCGSTGPFRPVFPPEPELPELLRKELDRFGKWWDDWRPPRKIQW